MNRGYQVWSTVARALLVIVLCGAAWWVGGYHPTAQTWLCGGVLAATFCWGLATLFDQGRVDTQPVLSRLTWIIIAWCVLLIWQLVPSQQGAPQQPRAVFPEWQPEVAPGRRALSIEPAATRSELAKYLCAGTVFVLGMNLFRTSGSRIWLYGPLAFNGAALAVFGVIQKSTWNDKLFWTIPLRFGGSVFASFVNRNHAANYLNLCLGAAAGLALLEISLGRGTKGRGQNSSRHRLGEEQDKTPDEEDQPPAKAPLMTLVLATLIVVGIVASLSRGGIIGLSLGVSVALFLSAKALGTRGVMVAVVVLGCALAAVGWLGFQNALRGRLETISGMSVLGESRLEHWKDTWSAVQDFPWLGQGVGSYHYANRPYQRHFLPGWYVNADNQYLELLVETGWVGMSLVLAGLLTFSRSLRRLYRLGGKQRDALLCGVIVIVSQAFQSLTDFGIIMPANLFTFAALCGSCVGSANFGRLEAMRGKKLVQRPPAWWGHVASIVLCLVLGWAWSELSVTAESYLAWDNLPELNNSTDLNELKTELALSRVTKALLSRPDDANLHQAAANLWIYRYRIKRLENLLNGQKTTGAEAERAWASTALPVLHAEVHQTETATPSLAVETWRKLPLIDENLRPARDHVRLAKQACPLLPRLELELTWLAFLDQDEDEYRQGEEHLKHEVFMSPVDPPLLFLCGMTGRAAEQFEFCETCWRQALLYSDEQFDQIVKEAADWLGNGELQERLFPDSFLLGVRFLERIPLSQRSSLALESLRKLLNAEKSSLSSWETLQWRARLSALEGDLPTAIELSGQALKESPLNVEWRLLRSEWLEQTGRRKEALEEVTTAKGYAPSRFDIQNRWKRLSSEKPRSSSPSR